MASLDDLKHSLPASSWLGVALIGIAVFVVGIYTPALGRFAYSTALEVVVAGAGGAVAVLGLSFWWDVREDEARHPVRPPLKGRAREVAIAPSFEVYRPEPVDRPPQRGEGPEDDP